MKVFDIIQILQDWIKAHPSRMPGYVAAHLMGSITHMSPHAVYPHYCHVGVSIILENDAEKPKAAEIVYEGVVIAYSYHFCHEYSRESVLSHPELTANLVAESLLDDPNRVLAPLQKKIRREYDHKEWIQARCEFEHRSMLVMLERMDHFPEAAAQASLFLSALGFLAGMVAAAHLQLPSTRRSFVMMRMLFHKMNRLYIHEHMLEIAGFAHMTRYQVEGYLADATIAFDTALEVKCSPHSFDHSLHASLRTSLVDGALDMIQNGCHREAMIWIAAFYLNCWDVIARDGDDVTKTMLGPKARIFLNDLGLASRFNRKDRSELVKAFAQEIFAILMSDVVMVDMNNHHVGV